MNSELVLQIAQHALQLTLMLMAILLLPALAVGLLVSMFQAATQINEQTLSFLPRLLITLLVIMWAGPWILAKLTTHFTTLVKNIPYVIG